MAHTHHKESYELEQKHHETVLISAYKAEVTLHMGDSYVDIDWNNLDEVIAKLTEMQNNRLQQIGGE